MLKSNKLLISIIVCALFAVSCSVQDTFDGQCINTFQDFAFSPIEKQSGDVLPPDPWIIESQINNIENLSPYRVELSRSIGDFSEVWIRAKIACEDCSSDIDAEFYYYLIYNSKTKDWKIIPAQIDGSIFYAYDLFLTTDGHVWARNTWDEYLLSGIDADDKFLNNSPYNDTPLLSIYNEKKHRFEFREGAEAIPLFGKKDTNNGIYLNEVLLDDSGKIWVFVHQDGIYNVDINSQKVTRVSGMSDLVVNLTSLAPDGSIYFGNANNMSLELDVELHRFYPETGSMHLVEVPSSKLPQINNMLTDRNGQLWLDVVLVKDNNNEWQRVYPHPWRFMLGLRLNSIKWREVPSIVLESSNGILWTRHGSKGMAWFNPRLNDGCWFTTTPTSIVEDEHRNLWIIVNDILYRLPAGPQ